MQRSIRTIASLLLMGCMQACIYANVNTPLSYRAPTPADVGGAGQLGQAVSGEACSHVVLGLVAWGDGGYAAAVADARSKANATLLADVEADRSAFNVLGIYMRGCTQVTGRVVK